MAGDTVIRIGEVPDLFYMIKKGSVEILATDRNTRIAILEVGAYFGEIGLLLNNTKRTVEVKALTNCIFACLNKNKFNLIMNLFPAQKNILLNVYIKKNINTNYFIKNYSLLIIIIFFIQNSSEKLKITIIKYYRNNII